VTALYDILVVGAGPIGLSTALLARRRGLRPLVVDRGTIANHLLDFPLGMPFFGPAHSLELVGIPLDIGHKHATREDLLSYYGRLARLAELEIDADRSFERLEGHDGDFTAITRTGDGRTVAYRCRKLVLAIGVFGRPRRLPEIPGIDLPKVGYLYREPYSYVGKDVLLVGAGNSSAGAALALHHAGARVTVLDRNPAIAPSKWRWHMEDLRQLVDSGEIRLLRRATLEHIEPDAVRVDVGGQRVRLANDAVLAQLGYEPDVPLFERLGITFDAVSRMPRIDVHSFETDVRGVYLAGIVCAGTSPDLIFVWGARNHPRVILAHILGEPPPLALEDLGRTTVAHWVQFQYLSDDLDEALALRMVPVVAGEVRDDVFDVYEHATHTTSLYTDGPQAELASTERWKVGPVLGALDGWLVQRNADGSGVYKGQALSANAFEILRLCDGTRRISGIVEALAAQYEQSEGELRGPVLQLLLSLLYTGRLNWRATPTAAAPGDRGGDGSPPQ
jgi:thioredoxin reductase (NADPH)